MAEIKKKLATVKTLAIQKACRLCPKRNPTATSSLAAYATHSYVCRVQHDVEIRSDFGAIAVLAVRAADVNLHPFLAAILQVRTECIIAVGISCTQLHRSSLLARHAVRYRVRAARGEKLRATHCGRCSMTSAKRRGRARADLNENVQ